MNQVRLNTNLLDYAIVVVYFVVVLGIGIVAKRYIKTSLDYFLSGRSLPAWITGLAFISANLGATEILGQSANGAQYGVATANYYWVGAIPAMVFLGLVMMPFYYGSKVRSVPEYLRLRFNKSSHVLNSLLFAVATVLIAGVNLYALALVLNFMLGWPIIVGIVVPPPWCSPTSPSAASRARSTTRSCSSGSSSPRSCRSRSSASTPSAAGAAWRRRSATPSSGRRACMRSKGRASAT